MVEDPFQIQKSPDSPITYFEIMPAQDAQQREGNWMIEHCGRGGSLICRENSKLLRLAFFCGKCQVNVGVKCQKMQCVLDALYTIVMTLYPSDISKYIFCKQQITKWYDVTFMNLASATQCTPNI